MLQELKRLSKVKTLCEISLNADDTSKFSVGYILACDDTNYISWYVDPYGLYDGLSCRPVELVYRIQTGTLYLKDIEVLMRGRNVQLNTALKYKDNLFINFLKQIKDEKRICIFELYESDCDDVMGLIDEVDENRQLVKVSLVNDRGQSDGQATVDFETISRVYYQSLLTTKLEILHNSQQ